MKPENVNMTKFLLHHGVRARVKYFPAGSVRGWRLSDWDTAWTEPLWTKLNALGLRNYNGQPLGPGVSNGGRFSVICCGLESLRTAPAELKGEPAALINEIIPLDPTEQPTNDEQLSRLAGVIASARDAWRARCKEYYAKHGDNGSCVMGAGIACKYLAPRCRTPVDRMLIAAHEVTSGQGSLIWENSVDEFVKMLREAGIVSAFYECGRMD